MTTEESEIESRQQYVVFAMRRFGLIATVLLARRYGADLESTIRMHSATHRAILPRRGILVPLTNRIAEECPTLACEIDYDAALISAH